MVPRCPQEMVAVRKPAISMSSFLVKHAKQKFIGWDVEHLNWEQFQDICNMQPSYADLRKVYKLWAIDYKDEVEFANLRDASPIWNNK